MEQGAVTGGNVAAVQLDMPPKQLPTAGLGVAAAAFLRAAALPRPPAAALPLPCAGAGDGDGDTAALAAAGLLPGAPLPRLGMRGFLLPAPAFAAFADADFVAAAGPSSSES